MTASDQAVQSAAAPTAVRLGAMVAGAQASHEPAALLLSIRQAPSRYGRTPGVSSGNPAARRMR